jgi:hypothetical protein
LLAFVLIGPITFIPYIMNGQGDTMLNRKTGGAMTLSLCT